MTKVLTPEAEREHSDFVELFGHDGNCRCFDGCAPCFSCTHPGNPRNQAEDEAAWMWEDFAYQLDEMECNARAAVQSVIDKAAARHLAAMASTWSPPCQT